MNKTICKRGLGAAACALLGVANPAPAAEAEWEFDSATMVYAESDRVSLVEPVFSVRRRWDERSLSGRLTLDTLTGPSPNGATPASTPQTFTGPSGNGTYTATPGEVPLDDNFKDTRVALAAEYSAPLTEHWTASYGLNASNEYDYLSLGGSLRLQRSFNQNNTTLSIGASLAQDSIEPVGGVPDPLTILQIREPIGEDGGDDNDDFTPDGEDRSARKGSESKTVVDALVGVTQVIDGDSLFRVNLVLSQVSGYQTDPYKIVSVVGADGEPLRYVRESRPDSRTKTGVYGEYLRAFGANTLRTSYRFMTDDWGADSHTLEASWRWRLTAQTYLEPQLRYYLQDAADFYRVALFDGEERGLSEVTADYRLGGMDAITVGLQAGHTLRGGSEMTLRLGYYLQTPDEAPLPAAAAEGLSRFGELVPETTAVMVTFGYRFGL